MMRRILAAVLVVAGVATLTVSGSGPAAAADLQKATWWSRTATTDPLSESPQPLPFPNPTAPAPLPNPTVPDGQLLVEGSLEGTLALATIHWTLRDGESNPSLTLPIGPGSTVTPESVILACRTATEWEEPETRPGRWNAKPAVDVSACINGMIADDLSTVTFGLQPLARHERLDITLVPGRDPNLPAGADTSTFRWMFEDPPVEALEVIDSGFEFGADPVVVTLPEPDEGSAPIPATAPTPSAVPSSSASFSPAASPSTTSGSSPFGTPALEPSDLASSEVAAPLVPALATPDEDTSRTIGIVLLLAGLAAAAWSYLSPAPADHAMVGLGRFRRPAPAAATSPEPSPGPLVPASTVVSGGLGRFTKDRAEPPVPVR